ncbi:TlpA family protein disulfide reductase [Thiohalobacter sp.]|uniref:TlpA family protein disulfide reductase n=1 Tax=Thiohalobacter sp. TaxID=2025948 RepID=UPI00262A5B4F|nr:TlpA disulfide reductase family protein [Thiohalobacter sp.]
MKAESAMYSAHLRSYPSPEAARRWLLLALWLLAGPALAALGHALSPLPEPVPAPDFELEDMDGNRHRLSDLRGKVVMLNFWATWCGPCREELPSLEALYRDLRDQGFEVLAINQWETPDHVFSYMGQIDVFPTFPILFDRDSRVSELYGIRGLPTTLVVDPEGRVVYRAIGGRNFDHPEVRGLIRRLLGRSPATDN